MLGDAVRILSWHLQQDPTLVVAESKILGGRGDNALWKSRAADHRS